MLERSKGGHLYPLRMTIIELRWWLTTPANFNAILRSLPRCLNLLSHLASIDLNSSPDGGLSNVSEVSPVGPSDGNDPCFFFHTLGHVKTRLINSGLMSLRTACYGTAPIRG